MTEHKLSRSKSQADLQADDGEPEEHEEECGPAGQRARQPHLDVGRPEGGRQGVARCCQTMPAVTSATRRGGVGGGGIKGGSSALGARLREEGDGIWNCVHGGL